MTEEQSLDIIKDDISCKDLSDIFSKVDITDIKKLNLPDLDLGDFPKPSAPDIKLNFELNMKFGEMFKNFSLAFPDIELGDFGFSKVNFDFLAFKLGLSDFGSTKLKLGNPFSDIMDKINIPGIDKDTLEKLLKKLPGCDEFKNKSIENYNKYKNFGE